jgi:hypothetical protein
MSRIAFALIIFVRANPALGDVRSAQKLKWVCLIGVSAWPSKTDMRRPQRHVGFVPDSDMGH